MRRRGLLTVFMTILTWAIPGGVCIAQSSSSPVHFVDPRIGTDAHGHTYPGASVPFGMVQLSPDAGKSGWDWCSGYHFSDSSLAGFSHTHLSGTGCGDLGDILFTPGTSSRILADHYRAPFHHDQEETVAGYYRVTLENPRIEVELTATARAGFHRYAFPPSDSAMIMINLGYGQDDITIDSFCSLEDDSTFIGARVSNGWAVKQRVYFAARFSSPVRSVALFDNGAAVPGARIAHGRTVKALLRFVAAPGERLLAKVGISAVSPAGALANLHEEIPGWDFAGIRRMAAEEWDRQLRKISIQAEDDAQKTVFYTALYHTMLAPTLYSDRDMRYRGADDSVHRAQGHDLYSTFSLWDTFRSTHPLFTIMHPERSAEMVNSMLAFAREGGHLPVWPLAANETNTMIGYHAVPVIADAFGKGITGFDIHEAYRSMRSSALRDHRGLRYYAPSLASAVLLPDDTNEHWPPTQAQSTINGYAATVRGDTIDYHSAHPLVTRALIIRATDGKSTMKWITGVAPERTHGTALSIVWLAGVAAGKGGHRFTLTLNTTRILHFTAAETSTHRTWTAQGKDGATLSFRATSTDWFGDLFGTMVLTVPWHLVKAREHQELEVTAEQGGSQDWYMTFLHSFTPGLHLSNEYGLIREGEKEYQLVRADNEYLGPPVKTTVKADGVTQFDAWIAPGLSTVWLKVPAVKAETTMRVTFHQGKHPFARGSIAVVPIRPVGYIPADREPESVSKTLEYAFDDWCIARVANSLGYKDDYDLFTARAAYYRNLYDSSTGFMRGRNLDGSWRTPFNPRFSTLKQPEYTEGNAWQYTWFVPHDVEGLITLMGGREKFTERLDSLFHQSSNLEGTGAPADVSGLIGLYAHGNEPSHHVAYLYTYAGKPWKTQELVRRIMRSMYAATPDGLCGNEDCGQMSSWYVMSALGLYPVNPADGLYVIGSPAVAGAVIDCGDGKTFSIRVRNWSEENVYVQAVTLNGTPLRRTYVRHAEVMAGGVLEFLMAGTPNTQWGTDPGAAPPSMSKPDVHE